MKNVWKTMLVLGLLGCSTMRNAEQIAIGYPIEAVELNRIKLTDQFWLPRIEMIQKEVIAHAFRKCETEGRIDNFVTANKVMNGESGITKGKMPFDDTDVYKILEGVAYSLINKPNKQLEKYSDSIISVIALGQEPDGYLTTWRTIDPYHPTSEWVPGGPRWSHLEISHELYNSGHLFEAATAYYNATGKTDLLNIALKNADLLVDEFSEGNQSMVPGHQIVETGLIKLYAITGKEDYLNLAKRFLDLRGDSTQRQIWGARNIQDHKPVLQQSEAVGHAVRAVYMYAGMTDIAALCNDTDYLKAVKRLWDNMTNKKMYVTGGIGARHHLEEFGDNYELPNLTAYSETCASIGSVYWNERLFRLTGDAKYYDIIERTLYNGVLAGISLDGTHFFYPNPLESDGEYAFNKGSCTREEWFDCSCCPTNLIRFIPNIPNMIYATRHNTLYVNLYMANEAKVTLQNKNVHIRQITNYPWNSQISMNISPEKEMNFTLKVRIPGWALNRPVPGNLYQYNNTTGGNYVISVNGIKVASDLNNGYFDIQRKWAPGDVVTIDLPMEVRHISADSKVENLRHHAAIEYGPLVYCAEQHDNELNIDKIKLVADDEYTVACNLDFLDGINIIHKHNPKNDCTFIPYYTWANRGAGKMKVWFEID